MLRQMRELREQEREKRLFVEQQLAEERKRFDQLRDTTCQMILEITREEIAEMRAERREAAEERRQNIATQQALLDTIVRLAQQQNGNGHGENRDG